MRSQFGEAYPTYAQPEDFNWPVPLSDSWFQRKNRADTEYLKAGAPGAFQEISRRCSKPFCRYFQYFQYQHGHVIVLRRSAGEVVGDAEHLAHHFFRGL